MIDFHRPSHILISTTKHTIEKALKSSQDLFIKKYLNSVSLLPINRLKKQWYFIRLRIICYYIIMLKLKSMVTTKLHNKE